MLDIRYIVKDNTSIFNLQDKTTLNDKRKAEIISGNKEIKAVTEKYSHAYYVDFNDIS